MAVVLRNRDQLSVPRPRPGSMNVMSGRRASLYATIPRKRDSLYSVRSMRLSETQYRLSLNLDAGEVQPFRKTQLDDLRSEKGRYLKQKARLYRKVLFTCI